MIKIITDSSSNISQKEAKELGVTVLPLTIMFGETQYRDGVDLLSEEFYKKLVTSSEFPHTSQIGEEQLTKAYDEACADGSEVLVLTIAGALSGSYELAKKVAERPEYKTVTVYNTRCTTIMLKMLVEYAAAHKSEPAQKVVKGLDDLRRRMKLYACLDTLEYLRKGGRLSSATAAIGALLKIKPIITLSDEGKVEMVGKQLGMARGIKTIADMFKKDKVDGTPVMIYTMNNTNALSLMEKCGLSGLTPVNMCPVIGAHIGPDACGIVYITK